MAHRPPAVLIEAELESALERFRQYLTRGRAVQRTRGSDVRPRKNTTPATAKGYADRIKPFLRWAGTLNPTQEQAREYNEHMLYDARTKAQYGAKEQSPSSVRQVAYALRAWFEYRKTPLPEAGDGALTIPSLPSLEHVTFLKTDEVQRLLEGVDRERDHAIIQTILGSGIRSAECAALKVGQVDAEARTLHIPARGEDNQAAGKGESAHVVHMTEKAARVLRDYIARRKDGGTDPEAPLFPSLKTGRHMRPKAVSDVVRRWSPGTIGRRVSGHVLRHTFATHAGSRAKGKKEQMPLHALQQQMDHGSKATTLRYMHAMDALDRDTFDATAPAF